MTIPRVLVIAGSDSGGGAGIQADIRTITMLGGHPMTAITAITAQNTQGVRAVHPVPTKMVLAQIDAVVEDIGVDAVKIGMIGSAETARAVAARLDPALPRHKDAPPVHVVFDPVMVATSGATLADPDTVETFELLMRRSTLVTPNVPELELLTSRKIMSHFALKDAAHALADRIGTAVLAKGGHLPGEELVDWLIGGPSPTWGDGSIDRRIATLHNHGTGCTLASGIATGLAAGLPLAGAVTRARAFVRAALLAAPGFGSGHGPMGHALGLAPFDVLQPEALSYTREPG